MSSSSSSSSEDDVIAAALIIASWKERRQLKCRRKRRWWSLTLYRHREQYGINAIMQDLRREKNSGRIENFLRMSEEDFTFLLGRVAPFISKEDTRLRRAISAKERFIITLRFLSTGDSYESLSYLARVSPHSISRIIVEVCAALISILADQIQMPQTPEGWKEIAKSFQERTHFPHCIGALDGKHVVMMNPYHAGSTYINYKKTFSIVLMALCDSNYCFTYANVGAQGRISDGGVLNACSLAAKLDSESLNAPPDEPLAEGRKRVPYVMVADNAFALRRNLLIPYPKKDGQIFNSAERIFNYRLSRARSRIENTFGVLASVFRIFQKPMLLQPDKVRLITECCVLLHNFLRRSRSSRQSYTPLGTFDSYIEVNGEIQRVDGSWRRENRNSSSFLSLRSVPRNPCRTGKDVRSEFGQYFISDSGAVPWQYYLQ